MRVLAIASMIAIITGCGEPTVADSIVRVVSGNSSGSGFFVAGPNGRVYVISAFHVVASGSSIIVERQVEVSDSEYYIRAYPDATVIGYNELADIAIIELTNVPTEEMPALRMGHPSKDEDVVSWGFPSSSFVERVGLTRKKGQIINFIELPITDRRDGGILRANATPALVVSTDLEPGFSGGPTLNQQNEVVGINVLKDQVHRGQDAAIHVRVLQELLDKVGRSEEPSAESIAAYLNRLQTDYLMLSVTERLRASELDAVALSDLTMLREFSRLLVQAEQTSGTQDSPAAILGMALSRLPGRMLQAYQAPETRTGLSACSKQLEAIKKFLDEFGVSDEAPAADRCLDLAVRPLAWDLVAATLHWEGSPTEFVASKVEKINAREHLYRANVRGASSAQLFPVFLTTAHGTLRLKLRDNNGRFYAFESPAATTVQDFQGEWRRAQPRTPLGEADWSAEEKLLVSALDDTRVGIRHNYTGRFYTSKDRIWKCSQTEVISQTLVQRFLGTLERGLINAQPQAEPETSGNACTPCGMPCYSPDAQVTLKRIGSRLLMYRTDGKTFPEFAEFERVIEGH